MKEIFLAGGCFWGMQKYFDNVVGVLNTQVGYANGIIPNPSYDDVCCGNTNFAETIWLRYDESVIDLNGFAGDKGLCSAGTGKISGFDCYGGHAAQELLCGGRLSPEISGKKPKRILPYWKGGVSVCGNLQAVTTVQAMRN